MINQPKVSVIITCYNIDNYVSDCLDSVISQTFNNLEIILVNDGSKDNTLNILKQYELKDNRILILNQENQGVSISRNTGLKNVTGDYIMFVDGDDWIELNTIEVAVMQIKYYDLYCFSFIKEYPNNQVIRDLLLDGEYSAKFFQRRLTGLIGTELIDPSHFETFATVWGKLFKAKLIKDHSISFKDINEIGAWEDGYFNWDYLNYSNSVFILNKPYYHYRKFNLASITSNHKTAMLKKTTHLFDLISYDVQKKDSDVELELALNNRIALSIIGLGLNEITKRGSLLNKHENIKNILKTPYFIQAYKNFPLKYFPTHWKLFFFFAKYKLVYPLITMLFIIKKIIRK